MPSAVAGSAPVSSRLTSPLPFNDLTLRGANPEKTLGPVSIPGPLVRRHSGSKGSRRARRSKSNPSEKEHDNAIHGDGQGDEGLRSGRAAGSEAAERHDEVQRGTGQGRDHARGRRAPAQLE